MSNTKNYIVTTLSSGSQEFNNSISNTYQAPFSLASSTVISLRQKGAPYTVSRAQNLYSRKILDAEPIIAPIAKYTFDVNPDDGTVNDDSGNGLTGTLHCATASTTTACQIPQFNNGTYGTNPLVGSYSLYLTSAYSAGGAPYKASYVQYQTLNQAPKWNILTGSFSVSIWMYPTFKNAKTRAKWPPGSGYYPPSFNQGDTILFGMTTNPKLMATNLYTAASGSFALILNQYNMDYYTTGPMAWRFRDPTNHSQITTWKYFWKKRNGDYQPYFTNEQWGHVMFCVSGSQGDGDRGVALYVNGEQLDAREVSGYNSYPSWLTASADGSMLIFNVTASTSTTAPEFVFLGDSRAYSGYDQHFSGSFDQVAVWNSYFTAKQVTQIYQSSGTLFDVEPANFPYNK